MRVCVCNPTHQLDHKVEKLAFVKWFQAPKLVHTYIHSCMQAYVPTQGGETRLHKMVKPAKLVRTNKHSYIHMYVCTTQVGQTRLHQMVPNSKARFATQRQTRQRQKKCGRKDIMVAKHHRNAPGPTIPRQMERSVPQTVFMGSEKSTRVFGVPRTGQF
jgi:hypothetical protein